MFSTDYFRNKYLEIPDPDMAIEEEKRVNSAIHPGEAPAAVTG